MDDSPAPDATPAIPANSVTLYATLSRRFGNSVGFDAETHEADMRCSAVGYVWNTDSGFHGKECSVTFRCDDTGRLAEFAKEHGLQGACGSVEVAANLEPDTFEDRGQQVALSPINIYIVLDNIAYAHTAEVLRSCSCDGGEASLTVNFSHRDFTRRWMGLADVDLAAKTSYPIVRFNVGRNPQENRKVRVPKYTYDPGTSASLTLTVRDTEIQVSMWQSDFSILEIKLTGKLRSPKLGIVSDEETIEIKEYEAERGRQKGYPEEAFPGLVGVTREAKETHCWVTLYATRTALMQLAAQLSGMTKGDKVILTVSMIAPALPLAIGDRREFNVTSYSPTLVKAYA